VNKIITVVVCSLLFLAASLFAAPQSDGKSVVQLAQQVQDVSTDIKLQQQKLDFYKNVSIFKTNGLVILTSL